MNSIKTNHEEQTKLLVVDDDVFLRDMIKHVGESRGFDISLAHNGLEALELATKERFKYIIMDIDMPIMNGIKATESIKLLPNGGEIEIFGFSGRMDEERLQACTNAGMKRVFLKPRQLQDIMNFIKNQSLGLTN